MSLNAWLVASLLLMIPGGKHIRKEDDIFINIYSMGMKRFQIKTKLPELNN